MRHFFFLILFCTAFLFLLAPQGVSATVKAADVQAALDSKSIVFGSCTNASVLKTYTNDHIVDWNGKKTAVPPAYPSTFLQMNGQEGNSKVESRSSRIKSAFSFEVTGARTISFSYRVATWGWNDDVLVFYEDDIDDPLGRDLGGEYWGKVYTEDGEKYWDLEYTDFWFDESIELPPTSYFHTVNVALLAPYWDPDDDEWCNPKKDEWYSDSVVQYKAWLDNFTAEESDYTVCDFDFPDGTVFGPKGGVVQLDTDYVDYDGEPVLSFYYTLDGTTPSTRSAQYDPDRGIEITRACTLRVAAYEKGSFISSDFSASYGIRPLPSSPTVEAKVQSPYAAGMEIAFAAQSEAPGLEFRYTLDGTEPTLDSPKGGSCMVTGPCTLKVTAVDEGVMGTIATFSVKRMDAPALRVMADGLLSRNGVFDSQAMVSATTQSGTDIYCRINGEAPSKYVSALKFTDSGCLEAIACRKEPAKEIAAGGECLMNSLPVTASVRKTAAGDASWLEMQLTQRPGWNLLAISKDISPAHGRELASWLTPVGFNASKKIFEKAEELVPGLAYWVYVEGTDLPSGKPAVFRYCERLEESVPTSVWQLLAGKASYTYKDGRIQKVDPQENLPGWARKK